MSDFRLTPSHVMLLRGTERTPVGLYHLQILQAEQLCRLFYSHGMLTTVKARLKQLVDNEYVQVDRMPTKADGKPPHYYTLNSRGIRFLSELGFAVPDQFRPSREVDKSYIYLKHTHELNDLLIAAALVNQTDDRYHVETLIHERVFLGKPISARINGAAVTLKPDAFLSFHVTLPTRQRRMPILLEHDRGSEDQKKFRRKIRAYISLLETDVFYQRLGVKKLTVAVTTFEGDAHVQELRKWTAEELRSTAESQQIADTFIFAGLPNPATPQQIWLDPCWYLVSNAPAFSLLSL
jgi:hypothetical protein